LPSLSVYTSNRLEILIDKLAAVIQAPPAPPLEPETIMVQSRGMERWVSMELARRLGICANIRFPFPNHFVSRVFSEVFPDLPEHSPYDTEAMTWWIMRNLPACLSLPGFEGLRHYLEGGDQLKTLQLARRIADTFDQYLVFRPEWVLEWEQGRGNHWQAVLWRKLVEENGKRHRAALAKALFRKLRDSDLTSISGIPSRLSVFGISALPRFHVQILSALTGLIEVNLFLMNPCREYWGDILSLREMKRAGETQDPDAPPESLHLEEGNPLLGSMGSLGRDFFDLVSELECGEQSEFSETGQSSLLSSVQSDILNLRNPRASRKRDLSQSDRSIQIHACHSPMREMEVLYDRLLDMFERNPQLHPRDILVMTPDIEAYTPYVQAVFDRPRDDRGYIPFSIADRSIRKESAVVEAFLALLDLCESRYGASQVLNILSSRPVRQRFGISEPELDLIRHWVKETRIRWGIDDHSRAELGLTSFRENTWRAGLERLLLGYALPGGDELIFAGVLPYDHIEGEEASLLGRLCEFTERIFSTIPELSRPRPPAEWIQTLGEILDAFFFSEEHAEREIQLIRNTLHHLDEVTSMARMEEPVDIALIRWYLGQRLQAEAASPGFMTGGVTFCAMLPMRSIPFKVICLVGMNTDAYPRESRPPSFDLLSQNPRRGDRSRRHDDRYLFLESLLSARETLYISFVGQSIQDNSEIPPSVLVSELIDYIEQGFENPYADIHECLVLRHRLQPFSPAYFRRGTRLFSYSEENLKSAMAMGEARRAPPGFISEGLSEPVAKWREVHIDELCRFFANPARFLLKYRLHINLEEASPILEEREAFELNGIDRYLLETEMVEKTLSGYDPRDLLMPARASGRLPHGTVGECVFEDLCRKTGRFAERTRECLQGTPLSSVDVDLRVSGFRLFGRISGLYPEHRVQYRYARLKATDHLSTWIRHLALSAARKGRPSGSTLVGLAGSSHKSLEWEAWMYRPATDSLAPLVNLLEIYWSGLTSPPPFFPETSWVYAQRLLERGERSDKAREAARRKWQSDFARGESEDPYFDLCFRYIDPLDGRFERLSLEIFSPLLKHQSRLGDKTF